MEESSRVLDRYLVGNCAMAEGLGGRSITRREKVKRVAIIQSCYIPWLGFFDLISRCDEYIIYDQVAFRSHHWHNRNLVKTAQGPLWLSIPVSAHLGQPIEEVEVKKGWAEKHWRTLAQSYARSGFVDREGPIIRKIYEGLSQEALLSTVNERFLRAVAERLGLRTRITRDREYEIEGSRSERVVSTCLAAGATHYLSGPSAKAYLDERLFAEAGIELEWMDYPVYREYAQPHGEFIRNLSIVDVLFNCGPRADEYLRPTPAYAVA
jgi:hypothetical protein